MGHPQPPGGHTGKQLRSERLSARDLRRGRYYKDCEAPDLQIAHDLDEVSIPRPTLSFCSTQPGPRDGSYGNDNSPVRSPNAASRLVIMSPSNRILPPIWSDHSDVGPPSAGDKDAKWGTTRGLSPNSY